MNTAQDIYSDWLTFGLFFIALLILIGIAELIRRRQKWQVEATRKIVHIMTGVLVATTPFVLHSKWPLIVLGVVFTLFDFLAIRNKFFSAMHDTKRKSYGTVFYPVSFILLVFVLWDGNKLVFVTSMLIMAIADAAAAIIGERVSRPVPLNIGSERKTLQGSMAMAISTFMIVIFSFYFFGALLGVRVGIGLTLWSAVVTAIFAAVSEVVSFRGSDNLTVPLASAFVLYFMLTQSADDRLFFSMGLLMAAVVAGLSFKFKFLDAGGSVATFILGTVVFGIGRIAFTGPILAFFILSSILSKLGKKRKNKLTPVFEKTGCRDIGQVLANGGIAGILVLAWFFFRNDLLFFLYLGSLAAVTADTWGTELGVLSSASPVSVISFKRVAAGTSGGITTIGTLGALLGSFVLVSIGWLSGTTNSPQISSVLQFMIIVSAGFLAGLMDSIMGATVQGQFYCTICNKETEKKIHCQNTPTKQKSGYLWINNDIVNVFCALFGVLFVLGGILLITG
ncbi:DUF92 domain-containing protein [candidate division KSB1 bacterium]|nr:DUF92 domain-containing protein [candidate division KSB1 bacterium]